jgi:CDP-diglyceride synthetase
VLHQLAEGAIAMAPLFFGLLAHGLCIRFGALRQLTRPLSTRLFGANKTYRGMACVALGTAVGFVLIRPSLLPMKQPGLALVGICVGAAAMAAELPNSFLKRRLGIAPGSQASGARGVAFHVLDQVDMVFGAWAVLVWLVTPTWARLAGSLATVYVGHQLISVAGYGLGMRTSAR